MAGKKKKGGPKPKLVNVMGKTVPEKKLKSALRNVLKARGLSGDLILEKKMTRAELRKSQQDDYRYANVYKYAFF